MIENVIVPRIFNLPGSLVNQIAAGEVIERPASVVKELIENAIDSNATRIDIDIGRGGTEKIIVRDNGHGIHPDDIELSILRHSTSKLQSQQDLDAIKSLGFRGEALSSIASVSDFRITSRTAGQDFGIKLEINPNTAIPEISPAAHETGTTVEVYKLFHPVPARRKFLRSDKTEFLHIQEIVKRCVLSRFDIDINFHHNGKLVLRCPASGSDYRIRISSVFGDNFYNTAWKIDRRIGDMQLWGWLGGKSAARSQSDRQYLFLNHRIIRDKHINHAIRKVLDNIIPDARYPSYVLHLFIDPSSVDVNVHPAKQEVRFKQQRDIHDFVYAVLSDTVKQGMPDQANLNINQDVVHSTRYYRDKSEANVIKDLTSLYALENADSSLANTVNPLGIPIVVLHDKYLLTRYGDDIRIIDYNQLRHHYLYAILLDQLRESKVIQRPILVPVMLTFKESLMSEIFANKDVLDRLGITIAEAGPQTMSVRSIPSLLPELDINTFFSKNSELWRLHKSDSDSFEKNCLFAMVDAVCSDSQRQYSLKEIQQALSLMTDLDLPYAEKKYKSIWNTISVSDLVGLIHVGN